MWPVTSSAGTGDTLAVRVGVAARRIGVAAGILSVALGLAVVAWPKATIGAVAILFGLQLMIHGGYRIVLAVVAAEADGGARFLSTVLGVLSFCLGVLALRHPFQTVAVMALVFGLFWVIGGIIELVGVLGARGTCGRGWKAALAAVPVVAGLLVLAYPGITLPTLTWLFGLWLIAWGLLTISSNLWIRYMDEAGQ